MFKALSNPQRLRIFLTFCTCCAPGPCSTTDAGMGSCVVSLGEDLRLAASTVSHHIKELRQAGLIRVERRGQRIDCSISEDVVEMLQAFFAAVRKER